MKTIEKLISIEIVKMCMGVVPNTPKIALVVWARNPPKKVFSYLVEISKIIGAGNSPTIFVDDICSMLDTGKLTSEQSSMNNQYRDFFGSLCCDTVFSSDLMQAHDFLSVTRELTPLSDRVTSNEFKSCLPLEKRATINELSVLEYYHFLLELWLLDRASMASNAIVAGGFSQAIIACHRNVSKKPMSAILLPKISENDFDENYSKIKQTLLV